MFLGSFVMFWIEAKLEHKKLLDFYIKDCNVTTDLIPN